MINLCMWILYGPKKKHLTLLKRGVGGQENFLEEVVLQLFLER